ncbi:MAG TPA: serine hydrolase domain-containing protein [Desulfovibrio sp.]|uniref:serine hydrolase domain-containing protein n=1 Tax=Desulfovibrio sp. TaxID=885 RepID=UPI002D272872|nr:serine hydrolase domain-containing protein [Desulfovibrio sp.]HZF62485.1 serine hydrolase domain-containing protein [Desulfovibrio sp.]
MVRQSARSLACEFLRGLYAYLGGIMIHRRAVSSRLSQALRVICLSAVLGMACLMLVACAGKKTREADDLRRTVVEMASKKAALPEVPGLSVALLRKGEDTPVCAAFGNAALENPTPLTTDSRFKIGSVTKVFTATLIHRLIEEGKLEYNTPISRFFPTYPNGKDITVRNLLEHTSGMPEMLALAQVQQNLARYWSAMELIDMVAKQPPLFRSGTRQQYCNTGFLMLAVIAEKITGRPYGEQVLDMFVGKLGMESLVVGVDGEVVPRLANGYTSNGSKMQLPLQPVLLLPRAQATLKPHRMMWCAL